MKQAILVVSFGTSYLDTLERTIAATEAAIAAAFPTWTVRRAFTSGMIMRKLRTRDGIEIDSVPQALERLLAEGFTRVVVQPTHMMHGEEYEKLCAQVAPYRNRLCLSVGMPLLHSLEDYRQLTQALLDWLPTPEPQQALVLMGHGTEHFANSAYAQLDYMLSEGGRAVYVATVEGYPTLEQVLGRLQEQITHVTLAPLMLVAGDHARNDMAGDEDSWKAELEAEGYQVTCLLQGLGECAAVREIFVAHCQVAMEAMQAAQGILYGVGVGPGDPELLTLKAVRTLERADVVLVPDTGKAQLAARRIVQEYIVGKTVEAVSTPMTSDKSVVTQAYQTIADRVCTLLDQGLQVAYVTLGDPTIYSTYMYVHRLVLERGYRAELIPGVPSFCAAAARLNTDLCQGEEALLVIPTLAAGERERLPLTRVYMKSGRAILDLQQQLRERGSLERTAMVENCGMPGERVYPHFADLEETAGYFSLVIEKGGQL